MTELSAEDKAVIDKLEAPGAGLPLVQKLALKFYYGPFVSKRADWEADREAFAAVNAKILKTAQGIPPELLEKRVLVPKQQGLEDSSRYWSAAMVLEHLIIVGTGMAGIIRAIGCGSVPPGAVDIAQVKPRGGPGAKDHVIANFTKFSDTLMDAIDAGVKDRDSKTTFDHPWFGPFTARQWHWLLAVHSGIHLKQIREIAKALKKAA